MPGKSTRTGATASAVTATEFKQSFGETLERAFRGERVRVIRHGRVDEQLVLIRESELEQLEARVAAPLDALRAEFDRRVARMQSPAGRKSVARLGNATMKELGAAAVRGSRKRG